MKWPNEAQLQALRNYGVITVVAAVHTNWDGGTTSHIRFTFPFFGQDSEAQAFAQLGRAGFDSTITGLRDTFDEIVAQLIGEKDSDGYRGGGKLDGNCDGLIVLDVTSGSYQSDWRDE